MGRRPVTERLRTTPLNSLHKELGAKMAPFAGYEMPVQFPLGVMKEHLHTREKAGLFDVSHMGQAVLRARDKGAGHEAVAALMERLCPSEIQKLKPGRLRYTALLNEEGGVLDDLMATRPADPDAAGSLGLVVNGAVKDNDFAVIAEALAGEATLDVLEDQALLALQGPAAASIMDEIAPGAATAPFMSAFSADWRGVPLTISRAGYTGEDGFEISLPAASAEAFARALLERDAVEPIGLGARDSLRLEAGLCLYGADMTEETSPVEANIGFIIGKRRREEGGFRGASRILDEMREGPARLRVGIAPEGRAPARAGTEIQSDDGAVVGAVTSGGFSPTLGVPIAMGYVDRSHAETGSQVYLLVRGKPAPARVVDLPFVPPNYFRG